MRHYGYIALTFLLILLAGCDQIKGIQNRQIVNAWFEQEIAGQAPYKVQGISDYNLVRHNIVKSSNDIVTVELVFKNRRGGDIVETHNFRVDSKGMVGMLK